MNSQACCKTKNPPETSLNISTLVRVAVSTHAWSRFYPLIVTFLFVLTGGLITQYPIPDSFEYHIFMNNLMGILLLTFSYLKILNPTGFQTAFAKYDMLAFYVPIYGYVYPLIEFTLGVFYCLHLFSLVINSLTIFFLVLNLSQVARALFLKKNLECACMGSLGFKLPLSYITISEDIIMIVMAGVMIGTQR